ncbi:MAG: class I SAM-dependent methyltransferase [Ferruginibacter sp.]
MQDQENNAEIIPAADIFNRHAQVYQQRFMDVSLYADTLDIFCSKINKEDAAILDIACGPGNITKYILNKRPGFAVLGIDLSKNMIELAKANNPTGVFKMMDAADIHRLDTKYEGIVCGFCFPYLPQEKTIQLIKDAASLLNINGAFYLSTIEGEHSRSGIKINRYGEQVMMYYYEAGFLVDTLKKNHFMIDDIRRKTYIYGEEEITDVIIVAHKTNES